MRGLSSHIASLRLGFSPAEPHLKPEEPRDAKGKVTQQMVEGQSYVETADQVALTSAFEMHLRIDLVVPFGRWSKYSELS